MDPGGALLSPDHQLLAMKEVSTSVRGAQGTAKGTLVSHCLSPAGMKMGFTETPVQETTVRSKIREAPKLLRWVSVVLQGGAQTIKEVRSATACGFVYLLPCQ